MKVYEVKVTIIVAAENAQDAEDVIGQAIEPYAPNVALASDPAIEMVYIDGITETPYTPDPRT